MNDIESFNLAFEISEDEIDSKFGVSGRSLKVPSGMKGDRARLKSSQTTLKGNSCFSFWWVSFKSISKLTSQY